MTPLHRRTLLRGLGAASLTLPLIGSPWRRSQAAAPDARRLVLIPMLNGINGEFFWPTGSQMKLACEPLQPFADRLTFVRGIDMDGSENHYAVRSMFTGFPVSSYDSPDPDVPSIDQVVANAFEQQAATGLRSLHLAAIPALSIEHYQKHGRSTFFFAPEPVHYDANPVTAFDKHFGALDPGAEPAPSVDLRAEVIAAQQAELDQLSARLSASPTELAKLQQHHSALGALASGTAPPPPTDCSAAPLASVEALRAQLEGNEPGAYDNAIYSEIYDAQVDILARALVCGLTRVGTLQANEADGNNIVPVLGGRPHHLTSHEYGETFAICQQWYASKIARLLTALDVDDPLDPGTTVLDNTCVLWMSECNPNHGGTDIALLYAGSAGGRMPTGSVIDVDGATNKNLMRTIAEVMGAGSGADHFGGQAIEELML